MIRLKQEYTTFMTLWNSKNKTNVCYNCIINKVYKICMKIGLILVVSNPVNLRHVKWILNAQYHNIILTMFQGVNRIISLQDFINKNLVIWHQFINDFRLKFQATRWYFLSFLYCRFINYLRNLKEKEDIIFPFLSLSSGWYSVFSFPLLFPSISSFLESFSSLMLYIVYMQMGLCNNTKQNCFALDIEYTFTVKGLFVVCKHFYEKIETRIPDRFHLMYFPIFGILML